MSGPAGAVINFTKHMSKKVRTTCDLFFGHCCAWLIAALRLPPDMVGHFFALVARTLGLAESDQVLRLVSLDRVACCLTRNGAALIFFAFFSAVVVDAAVGAAAGLDTFTSHGCS